MLLPLAAVCLCAHSHDCRLDSRVRAAAQTKHDGVWAVGWVVPCGVCRRRTLHPPFTILDAALYLVTTSGCRAHQPGKWRSAALLLLLPCLQGLPVSGSSAAATQATLRPAKTGCLQGGDPAWEAWHAPHRRLL